MADYRKIMELALAGRSYGEIVEVVGCSRRDVSRVKQVIQTHGVSLASRVSDEDLGVWFPDGRRRCLRSMSNPTLRLCWVR